MPRDQVFISYSHEDAEWLNKLMTMLSPLKRKQTIDIWADTRMEAGVKWREEIDNALASAKVAVLLVSPHFLASDFIASNELPPLLKAAKAEGVKILWVAVSHALYEESEIWEYQAANNPRRPLDSLSPSDQNKALVEIANQIKWAANANP